VTMPPHESYVPVGPVRTARQCPDCHAITDRIDHCFRRGHPMFPQTDESTMTVPVYVQVVERREAE
jgi:hypothetical protein